MPNTTHTNRLTSLVALRFAENANYLTLGASANFQDQLAGKRNGQSYEFVLRGTGVTYDGKQLPSSRNFTERKITLSIENKGVTVDTDSIEEVTDLSWDVEVAQPNGKKLSNKWVKAAIATDLPACATAFVGSGFAPLAKASAHLQSISEEDVFGFIDPQMQAILTSNGQQFIPQGAPGDLYSKGFLGTFQGAKYIGQRFIKQVVVPDLGAVALSTDSSSAASVNATTGDLEIKIKGSGASTAVLKAGTPLFFDGVYACDTVGDVTAVLAAFILKEDVTLNGTTAVTAKFVNKDITAGGTMEIAKADGSALALTDFNSKSVTIPEAGTYFGGILHLDGAKEMEALPQLSTSNADTTRGTQAGLSVFETRFFDGEVLVNTTRWDAPILRGVVEPRGFAYVLLK